MVVIFVFAELSLQQVGDDTASASKKQKTAKAARVWKCNQRSTL